MVIDRLNILAIIRNGLKIDREARNRSMNVARALGPCFDPVDHVRIYWNLHNEYLYEIPGLFDRCMQFAICSLMHLIDSGS